MCGIVGILKPGPPAALKNQIEDLVPYLNHRGPDSWGSYGAPGIALGHTRLSIIDLEHGDQPMVSSRFALSYNGEIFNYLELREELKTLGVPCKTESDTEVLLRCFETWGIDCLKRLNGQFAFLIWDKKERVLTAARERFGIRPLYIFHDENQKEFYFSSELKVFDHLNHRSRYWNPERLLEHGLVWNTFGDGTVFNNIRSLEGGHYQQFTHDGARPPLAYYRLGDTAGNGMSLSENSAGTFQDTAQELRFRLKESVKLRLRSDVPVGCYLSGGIDSCVTSLLTNEITNHPFKTFSVAFSDPALDESVHQKTMASALNSDHHSIQINNSLVEDNFEQAVYYFERPVFRTAPVPLYLLSQKVRDEQVKVVLTGEAADEILFGYDTNKELKMLEKWKDGMPDHKILTHLKKLYPHLDHYKNQDQAGFLKLYYEGFLERFDGPLAGLTMRISNNQIIQQFLNKDWGVKFDWNDFSGRVQKLTPDYVKDWSLLKRNQYLEMKTLLPGYLLSAQGDRMAMANSIEGRFPFLDHTLIEWLLTVPDNLKLNGNSSKDLLKQAFKKDLPESIVNRPKRPYMAPDLPAFFPDNQPGRLVESYLSEERIREYGLFDPKMVKRYLFKLKRRELKNSGYRDNMIIVFLLSCQIIEEKIRQPHTKLTASRLCQKVNILEESK